MTSKNQVSSVEEQMNTVTQDKKKHTPALLEKVINASKYKHLNEIKKELKEKAVFDKDYILASGQISNSYCDVRELIYDVEILSQLLETIYIRLDEKTDFIAASKTSTYSLAFSFTSFLNLIEVELASLKSNQNKEYNKIKSKLKSFKKINPFFIRDSARQKGYSPWIEGPLKQQANITFIVDILENPDDLIKEINLLDDVSQSKTLQIITILDTQRSNSQRFKNLGINYQSLIYLDELIEVEEPKDNYRASNKNRSYSKKN